MAKKRKRSEAKYPALDPSLNPRVRREYMDYDYVKDLSEEDKKFLNDFTEEYYNASVKADVTQNKFHKTKELKKSVSDANNARNRCTYSIAKASGLVGDDVRPENDVKISNSDLFEDAMIAELDRKLEKERKD